MDKQLITRVFAIVQALEKCLEASRRMAETSGSKEKALDETLNQQQEMLGRMRRQANKLQLEFARGDWVQTVRSLQIFYGLNHMVRPEIMSTYAALANGIPSAREDRSPLASLH